MKLPHGIRKEPGLLLIKSFNSLTLAIELFNRPHDYGRSDSVLIMLDHSFEMLLKAAILHKGERIKEPGEKYTMAFQACVSKALSNANCKCLSDNESLVLATINALRDAAQHHLSHISEEQLWLHVQSGVTLFRDLTKRVFGIDIGLILPRRVLPISTVSFTSIEAFFDSQITEIQKLLAPGKRRRQEAIAALRPLAILDRALQGEDGQPTDRELRKIAARFKAGEDWRVVFLATNLIECVADGDGPTISLRIEKKADIPIRIAPFESNEGQTVALKRVNELDYYNLGPMQMASHLGITHPKFVALSRHLSLEADPEYFKLIVIGKQQIKRFSQKGLAYARSQASKLSEEEWADIWASHGTFSRNGGAREG